MRKSMIAGVALLSLFAGVGIARAEEKEIKGVLIDCRRNRSVRKTGVPRGSL